MRLRVEGLTKDFGALRAVDSLSFELADGEICGFIGPNGAGKTTTLRVLATVDHPTAGDAWLEGYSVSRDADKVRPLIGFMPDFFGSYPDMLVEEYIDFFARAYGLRGEGRRRAVRQVVEFTELGPLLRKRVTGLSRGMQQRMSLARALVHDPDLLLLDEPAAGLDPRARMDLQELLRLLAEGGKTVLISSHILAELEQLVEKVVIIDRGKLLYCGPLQDAEQDFVRRFTLTVRVMGELDAAARVALECPAVEQVRTDRPDLMRIEMSGGKEAIAAVVASLAAHGTPPYHVAAEDRRLERIFLEATEGTADESGA